MDRDRLPFVLAEKILDLLKESGANHTEAVCALDGAKAFLPDLDLCQKPIDLTRGVHGRCVRDFGARGDGVSDDTEAFRRAIP